MWQQLSIEAFSSVDDVMIIMKGLDAFKSVIPKKIFQYVLFNDILFLEWNILGFSMESL